MPPEVLAAAAKYVDAIHAYVLPAPFASVPRFYNTAQKPVILWLGLTAQQRSFLFRFLSSETVVDF